VRLQVAGLPIAAMMRDSSAVAFGEVAAKYPKNHSSSGTDNHEENPGRNSSSEVRKEEDSNSRIHQNRQYGSRHALRHVFTPYLSGRRTLWRNYHARLTIRLRLRRESAFERVRTSGIAHPTRRNQPLPEFLALKGGTSTMSVILEGVFALRVFSQSQFPSLELRKRLHSHPR
jgi:hypothetical protein